MTSRKFQCKCGEKFRSARHLAEHIGINNPRWPRVSPDDKHAMVCQEIGAKDC